MSDATSDRLDQQHIDEAAMWAAQQLRAAGHAVVLLTPGDMTQYPIVIVAPTPEWSSRGERTGDYYWVTLACSWGGSYEWPGRSVHRTYAIEKWTSRDASEGTRTCAGEAMSRFLSSLGQVLNGVAA